MNEIIVKLADDQISLIKFLGCPIDHIDDLNELNTMNLIHFVANYSGLYNGDTEITFQELTKLAKLGLVEKGLIAMETTLDSLLECQLTKKGLKEFTKLK